MNRSNFLRSLATIVVAPALLVIDKPAPKEPDKKWLCMSIVCSTEMYEDDPEGLQHFIFAEMKKRGFNPSKKYILDTGWENNNFTRNLVTILIRQETKDLLSQPISFASLNKNRF